MSDEPSSLRGRLTEVKESESGMLIGSSDLSERVERRCGYYERVSEKWLRPGSLSMYWLWCPVVASLDYQFPSQGRMKHWLGREGLAKNRWPAYLWGGCAVYEVMRGLKKWRL